jgi:hypothetical protein
MHSCAQLRSSFPVFSNLQRQALDLAEQQGVEKNSRTKAALPWEHWASRGSGLFTFSQGVVLHGPWFSFSLLTVISCHRPNSQPRHVQLARTLWSGYNRGTEMVERGQCNRLGSAVWRIKTAGVTWLYFLFACLKISNGRVQILEQQLVHRQVFTCRTKLEDSFSLLIGTWVEMGERLLICKWKPAKVLCIYFSLTDEDSKTWVEDWESLPWTETTVRSHLYSPALFGGYSVGIFP